MSLLISFVNVLFWLMNLAVFLRVVLSWLNPNPYNPNPLVSLIYQITNPILEPLRRIVPMVGPLDITPIVALFLLAMLQRIILSLLTAAAY
ncbi:MAG: YggT family protein [Chloroflexi bacterium]|nr:YggT family protein [Chloroflexota bacterium]